MGISIKDYLLMKSDVEYEVGAKNSKSVIRNLFTLPEYFFVYGVFLNQMYWAMAIFSVIITSRWILLLINFYQSYPDNKKI